MSLTPHHSSPVLSFYLCAQNSIVPTLQKITRHPHPRELIAHIAAILLEDYIFKVGPGAPVEEEEEEEEKEENGPTSDDAEAVVSLFRVGVNGETAEGYLRTLEALQAQAKRSSGALSGSAAVRAGSKRKALESGDGNTGNGDLRDGALSVVVLESLGTIADIPSAPTIRPVIIEIEAHLAKADIESAIRLCQSLESSSASSVDDKKTGWHNVLVFMDQKDVLFDPPAKEIVELPEGDTARTFQLLQVGSVGLKTIKRYFEEYAKQAITDAIEAGQELAAAVSPDDIAMSRENAEMAAARSEYVQFQVRRTMLRFLLTRNFSPSSALKEAQHIATPISPDGRGGVIDSYVGVDTGAPQSDAQALRKIHAILSTRYGEESSSMYLPRIQGVGAAASFTLPAPALPPALLEGPEAGHEQQQNEAIVALDDTSDEEDVAAVAGEQHGFLGLLPTRAERRHILDDRAAEARRAKARQRAEEAAPPEPASDAAEESESDDEVVVLDDDSDGTRSYEEPTHEEVGEEEEEEEGEEEPVSDDMDEADEATAEERSVRDDILFEEEEIAAQEEEARQQHLADLARQEINSQKREALARRREAPTNNDDTTAAHVAEGDNLSEYFTETSQGTQSGAEFELEPEPSQLSPAASIPRDKAGDAQPDSILIAAAVDSQRQQQQMQERLDKSTASPARRTGEEIFDDTTAVVAGTDLEQDEFLTDHGGASQSEPDILEAMALRAGELGPAPGEGTEARKTQRIDTESLDQRSMTVNPPDSPKGSVVLEPSEVGDSTTLASASGGRTGVEEEENEGLNDEDLINIEDIDDLSYSELQHHCK